MLPAQVKSPFVLDVGAFNRTLSLQKKLKANCSHSQFYQIGSSYKTYYIMSTEQPRERFPSKVTERYPGALLVQKPWVLTLPCYGRAVKRKSNDI